MAQAELTTRDEFNSPAFDVGASVFLFTADTTSATIAFGLATEKLRTIVMPQNGPRTTQFGSTTIEVSLPEEKDDRITIDTTVPQTLIDEYSMLFILVDRDGKRHYLSEHGEAVTGAEPALVKQEWGRHRPHYLRDSDIKECRIDFCRYQWIRFENVSLRPGEDPGFETEAQSL
ncbi:MAG TPA: hypothetical protein ENI81_07635 [Phycisphaerales bacterium]|nr:hypothetical protein [Phycisphaerales bacterium]